MTEKTIFDITELEKGCGNTVNYRKCKDGYLCPKCKVTLKERQHLKVEVEKIINEFDFATYHQKTAMMILT